MKKVLVLGVGAQGSTVTQRLDKEPNVSEIICGDYNKKAVKRLVKTLKKARGVKVDAENYKSIVKAARGVDLIINALPIEYGEHVLEAALEVNTNYMDFAVIEPIEDEYIKGVKYLYDHYGKRFAEIDKLALIGTGLAPGMVCVIARRLMRELDHCDTINILLYEAIKTKRFLPFWWSPVDALDAMAYNSFAFENGKIIITEPFTKPVYRKWPEMDYREVELVEHAHEEPVCMGINADAFFKGVKNINFKYGGTEVEFSKPLYQAGLLSYEEEVIRGRKIVPFDLVLAHIPPAPSTKEEIQEILDEGVLTEEAAVVIEAVGTKENKEIMLEAHLEAPDLETAFEREGISGDSYVIGQCGFFFAKMLLEDMFPQRGLISTDMLTDEQVDYYLDLAAEKDITCEMEIKNQK